MTHYWWMHWFWITYRVTLYFALTHSTPVSTIPSQIELDQNYSGHQPAINLIGETTISKPQIAITIPFLQSNITSTEIAKSSDPDLCLNYDKNKTINVNTTEPRYNIELCSKIFSENLQNESVDNIESKINITTNTNIIQDINITVDDTNNTTVIVSQTKELISAKVSESNNISSVSYWNAISITSVSFGIVICAAIIGIISFYLYRRRYLNKPQTLNDKCSNPDSSGYIDDSTMRENSEEMYSLDNDSFLNSLEAMTIQNYWTDSVKHTKL